MRQFLEDVKLRIEGKVTGNHRLIEARLECTVL